LDVVHDEVGNLTQVQSLDYLNIHIEKVAALHSFTSLEE
jgi:hypothetical protein